MGLNALNGHGAIIKRNGTAIAEVRDITLPPLSRNQFDSSGQADDDDTVVIGKTRRRGPLGFMINFIPANQTTAAAGVVKAYNDGTLDLWEVTLIDATRWICSGYTVGCDVKVPADGDMTADIKIKPSGPMFIV